jgi:hypothetical protein
MGYKLLCKDKCYLPQYFESLKDARVWLYQHGKNQLYVQCDIRHPKDVGHDINLRTTWTYGIAEYFDFELIKTI